MSILDHLADGDVDILAVLVSVGLRGLAPAAIQQDACCWPEADTASHLEVVGKVETVTCSICGEMTLRSA